MVSSCWLQALCYSEPLITACCDFTSDKEEHCELSVIHSSWRKIAISLIDPGDSGLGRSMSGNAC